MSFYTAFAEHYESIFPFSETVYGFLRDHMPEPPARVLDVGCGTGHYTGRLAEAGCEALGIDLDPAMIAYARTHHPEAAFRVLDMTRVARLDGPFDGAFCIGNTAAHLSRAAFAAFLADMAARLTPGAPWILQVMNWDYVLTQDAVAFPVIEGQDGAVFRRAYRDIAEDGVTFATRLEVDGEVLFEESVGLTPMRADAIVAAHEAEGFALELHAGGYDGSPFDPQTFSANLFVFRSERARPNPARSSAVEGEG